MNFSEEFEERDPCEQFDEPASGRSFEEDDYIMKAWTSSFVLWNASVPNLESVVFFVHPLNFGEYLVLREFINKVEPNVDVDCVVNSLQFIDNLSIYKYSEKK